MRTTHDNINLNKLQNLKQRTCQGKKRPKWIRVQYIWSSATKFVKSVKYSGRKYFQIHHFYSIFIPGSFRCVWISDVRGGNRARNHEQHPQQQQPTTNITSTCSHVLLLLHHSHAKFRRVRVNRRNVPPSPTFMVQLQQHVLDVGVAKCRHVALSTCRSSYSKLQCRCGTDRQCEGYHDLSYSAFPLLS